MSGTTPYVEEHLCPREVLFPLRSFKSSNCFYFAEANLAWKVSLKQHASLVPSFHFLPSDVAKQWILTVFQMTLSRHPAGGIDGDHPLLLGYTPEFDD